MAIIIWLIFGIIIIFGIAAPFYVLFNEKRGYLIILFIIILIIAIPITIYMSGKYKYVWNENTYAIGWPIPTVVMQRTSPDEPYLDFVGPTILLAYPINYCLFTIIPSLIFMIMAMKKKRSLTNGSSSIESGDAGLSDSP